MAFLFRPKNINFSQDIWILSRDIVPLTKSDSGQIKLEDKINKWGWHILEGKQERSTTFGCCFSLSILQKAKKKEAQLLFVQLFLLVYSVGDTIVGKGYPVMDNFSFSYCSVSFNQDPN